MAYARDSKSRSLTGLRVRLPSPVPLRKRATLCRPSSQLGIGGQSRLVRRGAEKAQAAGSEGDPYPPRFGSDEEDSLLRHQPCFVRLNHLEKRNRSTGRFFDAGQSARRATQGR